MRARVKPLKNGWYAVAEPEAGIIHLCKSKRLAALLLRLEPSLWRDLT
jgi:hypothetical protein